MEVLQEQDVVKRLDPRQLVGSVEAALRQLGAAEAGQPSQVQMPLPGDAGDTIFYTAASAKPPLLSMTVSPFIVARLAKGLSPVTAYTLLLCGGTGLPLALIESKTMVAARTGATTWIAARKLARRLDHIAIIGSGQVAEWHLRCIADASVKSLSFFSPNLSDPSKKDRRRELLALDERVRFAATASEAVDGAGVVMLCTASASPVIDPGAVPDDALITSITTDGPNAHEIEPSHLSNLDVYCDYRATTPSIASEMRLASERCGWSASRVIADLPELLQPEGSGPTQSTRRRYFRSVGLGIEDLAAAAAILGIPCT